MPFDPNSYEVKGMPAKFDPNAYSIQSSDDVSVSDKLKRSAIAAALGAGREQSVDLSKKLESPELSKIADDYPIAQGFGRFGSYLIPGLDEFGAASRLFKGVDALGHMGANAITKSIPEGFNALKGLVGLSANVAKVPVAAGIGVAAKDTAESLVNGEAPRPVQSFKDTASNPLVMALGLVGAAKAPEALYMASGLSEGKLPSKALQNSRTLMDLGIRDMTAEGLLNKIKERQGVVAGQRSAIIDKAAQKNPNYFTPSEDIIQPLADKSIELSKSLTHPEYGQPYGDLAVKVMNGAPGGYTVSELETLGQREKSAVRQAVPRGKLADVFSSLQDPMLSAKNKASTDLLSAISKAQHGQIADILPKDYSEFSSANKTYGTLADARSNAERIATDVPDQLNLGKTGNPLGFITRPLKKYVAPGVTTHGANILDKVTNQGILNQLIKNRMKQLQPEGGNE